MKKIVCVILFAMAVTVSTAFADGPSNNINFFFGQKTLSDDWDTIYGDYRDQAEFGILCDFRGRDWPLSIAVEFMGSAKQEDSLTGSTGEFGIGVKKIWEDPGTPIKPFVGIGLASITGKYEVRIDDDVVLSSEETGMGYFMEGGIYFTVGSNINLGALVRYSYASVSVDNDDDGEEDDDIDVGGTHAGVFVGFSF